MHDLRLVPVLRVRDRFHASVVAARLGSEGIVTQLRGGSDGVYPVGDVTVLVPADDLALAQELLLADEVESAFVEDEPSPALRRVPRWLVVAALLLLTGLAFGHLAVG